MRTFAIAETYPYQGRTARKVAAHDVAETIAPWFDAPEDSREDIRQAIEKLQERLMRDEYAGDLATYLGLSVKRDD